MPIAITTRFAPSPTGGLHLGHAFSALFADHFAAQATGRFLLRIEDIDSGRCRPEFEAAIVEDLTWLGLTWEEPIRRQSEHIGDYANALSRLEEEGLLYPCFCTRAYIRREIAESARAPHGPDGPLYPGSCRDLTPDECAERQARGLPFARRLDMKRAAVQAGPLFWNDQAVGRIAVEPNLFGDVILARKDVPTSYHLACTVDDHLQGVTLVTRGEDLFPSTHIHRLLQALLGLSTPSYHHHRLLTGNNGQRLATRNQAVTLSALRAAGVTPAEIKKRVGFG
jgi:glutamyl-Q tRNA(Asp) synthetase